MTQGARLSALHRGICRTPARAWTPGGPGVVYPSDSGGGQVAS